jgi:hypothetical protein
MKRILLTALVLAGILAVVIGTVPATAQSGNTWQADYWNNPDWSGNPVMTQWVPLISFDWGYGSPGPAVPADNFSARYMTTAFFYAGNYTFTLVADDEVVLIVDGNTLVDTRGRGQSGKSLAVTIPMWQGDHRIEVWYREFTVTAYVFVNWTFNGTAPGPTPTPPPGGSGNIYGLPGLPANQNPPLTTQFGDYTPCMQQNIHQVNCFVSNGAWDAPNEGSIAMEPQIQAWTVCQPADQVKPYYISPQVPTKNYVCSRTLAGWFPQ